MRIASNKYLEELLHVQHRGELNTKFTGRMNRDAQLKRFTNLQL